MDEVPINANAQTRIYPRVTGRPKGYRYLQNKELSTAQNLITCLRDYIYTLIVETLALFNQNTSHINIPERTASA